MLLGKIQLTKIKKNEGINIKQILINNYLPNKDNNNNKINQKNELEKSVILDDKKNKKIEKEKEKDFNMKNSDLISDYDKSENKKKHDS